MRVPTITTPLDDSCDPAGWRAETINPKGWLAGAGSTSPLPRAGTDPGRSTEPTEGSAAGGFDGAAVRTARRPDAARRRRRSRRRGPSRSFAVDRTVVAPAQRVGATRAPVTAGELQVDGYRMGRWARLTLTITVLAAIAVVTVSLVVGSAPQSMVDVTVGPGDTLWSIASQAAPDRDPRDVIEEIRALNEVPGGVLPVGIVLRVPSSVG